MTARDFAQTVGLCERLGIEHTVIGRHRGGRVAAKAAGLVGAVDRARALGARAPVRRRSRPRLQRRDRRRRAAAASRAATMFDYEWATVQHTINCRLARAVVVPDAIPPERLRRYGAAGQAAPLSRGSRRSTTSPTSSPTRRSSTSWASTPARPIAVVRTPPAVSLYHRFEHTLFAGVLDRLRGDADRRAPAHARAARRSCGGFIVPERAIDAQSLVAFADLVVSAGRHDEPRGRRARDAGLDDVRGPARAPSTSG